MKATEARARDEKLARRMAIITAAMHEFAAHGYEGGSIERIARACRIAVGTVYLYFPSKVALFIACISHGLLSEHADVAPGLIERVLLGADALVRRRDAEVSP